jgi:hypothetical protein
VAAALAGAGCHRSAMPPRPDGAAVVVASGAPVPDSDLKLADEAEPNDTTATAGRIPIALGAPAGVAGALRAPAGGKRDVDVYRVDIAAPDGGAAAPAPAPATTADGGAAAAPAPLRRSLRADLRPEAALGATLEALDDAGKVLVSAGGAAPGEAVAIPNLAVTPGTYYLRVRGGAADAAAGSYRLVVRLAPMDLGGEIEPNGVAALATELAPGAEAAGYLGWRRDQDWYRLPTAGLPEGSVLSVDLDPIPNVSASLLLYDAVERKLVEAHGRKESRVVLRSVRIPPGDAQVFVLVRADAGANADDRYDLRTRAELPKSGGESEPNDDPAHAQTIGDGTLSGYLARGDVDVFRYTAAGPTELDVEAAPPERVDIKLEILSDDGAPLAHADTGRRREAERIPNFYVAGGNVLIRLSMGRGDGNPDEPYRLSVSSRAPEPGAEREPNDTIATPTVLAPDTAGRGLIAPRGDVDFWKLAAAPDADGAVKVTVSGVAGVTLAVRILSDSGRELGRAKVPGDAPVTTRVSPACEGCCLVEIREATGKAANPRDRYTLTLGK